MREVVVFTGPTLAAEDVVAELDATVRPPASKGDVYEVARRRPFAIGIVDGYFDRVPSVWHKEILWAMSSGVHVFGSASMGALRAAELHGFGMVGVGAVFEAYRDGVLTDDDEVAVAHLPKRLDFRPRSVAMVNIRATVAAAVEAGVVSSGEGADLVARTKKLYYADRTYTALLSSAEAVLGDDASQSGPSRVRTLGAWIEANSVDQKREDALAMLSRLRELRQEGRPPSVRYTFSHTLMWEGLKREVDGAAPEVDEKEAQWTDGSPPSGPEESSIAPADVIEELRLEGSGYRRAMDRTWRRLLALELARARGETLDASERARALERWRAERGLEEDDRLREWQSEEGVDVPLLNRLAEDEALIRRVEHAYGANAEMYLRDHLRSSGRYGALQERARRKRAFLELRGLENPSVADTGLSEAELWRWYFEDRLGVDMPAHRSGHAGRLGFSSEAMFARAVARERLFIAESSEDGRIRPDT